MPAFPLLRRLAAPLLLLAALFSAGRADAQMHHGVELVHADLITDTAAITPGQSFTVGLRLKMAPHWHTYWQYSGDAGLPTKIEWQLPPGFTAGPLQWPLPEKIVSPGDIVNYGYNDEVVLLTEITPPAQGSGEAVIKGKAKWLVCEDICVPGSADLALKLPAGQDAAADGAVLARYRAALPQAYREDAAKLRLERKADGENFVLTLAKPAEDFFPLPGETAEAGHPVVSNDGLTITVPVASGAADVGKVGGVLVVESGNGSAGRTGYLISPLNEQAKAAPPAAAPIVPSANTGPKLGSSGGFANPAAPSAPAGSLGYFLLLGLLGGLILNVMPCVLPVISLKLFSFVKQSRESPERVLRLGLAYAAGVFAWFLGFAALVVILKGAGHEIGYAFHLQNPWFIVGLSVATFVFALNLLGVFEIVLPSRITNAAAVASGSREGIAGAFVQGVFATVLGSACTAPLVGPALGFAFAQPGLVIFAMFAAIAAGMSAPFVLIAFNPRWLRFLPKPGEWMERVKQGTGFLMLATVLWLLYTLGRMRGADAVVWTGVLLLAFGAACWVQGAFNTLVASDRARWLSRGAIAAILLVGGWLSIGQIRDARLPAATEGGMFASQLDTALKTGRPVFVDFTAEWCVNCKVNERAVLNTSPVQKALADRNALLLKADWTSGAEDITRLLRQFGRAGVPLYVLYPAGKPDAPVVMPELLTQRIVLDAFTEADHRAGISQPVAAR